MQPRGERLRNSGVVVVYYVRRDAHRALTNCDGRASRSCIEPVPQMPNAHHTRTFAFCVRDPPSCVAPYARERFDDQSFLLSRPRMSLVCVWWRLGCISLPLCCCSSHHPSLFFFFVKFPPRAFLLLLVAIFNHRPNANGWEELEPAQPRGLTKLLHFPPPPPPLLWPGRGQFIRK